MAHPQLLRLPFRFVSEDEPGARWEELYGRAGEAYRAWFLRDGDRARPPLVTARRKLVEYMPELVPTWSRLSALAGGDPKTARMLSLFNPPAYMVGCSQAIWIDGDPCLVRNYDFDPRATEATILHSRWAGTRVLATSECLWGCLDGMNEHGLVVALAFGGRQVVGEGFGIPLILRYALQTCRTVEEATAVLMRIPSHMAYNVSLLDAAGAYAVVQIAPDRPARVAPEAFCTNHQGEVEWSRYAEVTRSVERELRLRELLAIPGLSFESFVGSFLEPPLFVQDMERGYATLYTAVYRPADRSVRFLWHGAEVPQSLDAFRECVLEVPFAI